jgi:hypothetical protein
MKLNTHNGLLLSPLCDSNFSQVVQSSRADGIRRHSIARRVSQVPHAAWLLAGRTSREDGRQQTHSGKVGAWTLAHSNHRCSPSRCPRVRFASNESAIVLTSRLRLIKGAALGVICSMGQIVPCAQCHVSQKSEQFRTTVYGNSKTYKEQPGTMLALWDRHDVVLWRMRG